MGADGAGRAAGPLTPADNPDGVWTMEWSNAMAEVLRANTGGTVTGHFTPEPSPHPAGIPTIAPS